MAMPSDPFFSVMMASITSGIAVYNGLRGWKGACAFSAALAIFFILTAIGIMFGKLPT